MWFLKKNEEEGLGRQEKRAYRDCIESSAAMVANGTARKLAKKQGLNILNVTWEDTGRFKGSCVGPNISDMTIQVEHEGKLTCMPVIRFPNFSDKSADLKLDALVAGTSFSPSHTCTTR